MLKLEIEQQAKHDTNTIFTEGVYRFGIDQAISYLEELNNQFELLAEHPRIGRKIASRQYPNAYKFGLGVHMIVFSFDETTLTIHRIFHARSNYVRHL